MHGLQPQNLSKTRLSYGMILGLKGSSFEICKADVVLRVMVEPTSTLRNFPREENSTKLVQYNYCRTIRSSKHDRHGILWLLSREAESERFFAKDHHADDKCTATAEGLG